MALNLCEKCTDRNCDAKSITVFDIHFCIAPEYKGMYNIEKIKNLFYETDKKRKFILSTNRVNPNDINLFNKLNESMESVRYIFSTQANIISLNTQMQKDTFVFLKTSKEFHAKYHD